MNLTNQQKVNIAAVLGLIIALLSTVLQFINDQPVTEVATPLGANVPCYFDQGGKQFNIGSGCTLVIASGGALTANSGSATSFSNITGTLTTASQPNVTSVGSLSNLTATNTTLTGSLVVSGLVQYPFSFFGSDNAINGTMIAHGLGATPTYPWCMVYDAAWVTVTARISATNATSATLAIFDATGEPWTTSGVPVRCGAVHVP